jgi:hypothetical protein
VRVIILDNRLFAITTVFSSNIVFLKLPQLSGLLGVKSRSVAKSIVLVEKGWLVLFPMSR